MAANSRLIPLTVLVALLLCGGCGDPNGETDDVPWTGDDVTDAGSIDAGPSDVAPGASDPVDPGPREPTEDDAIPGSALLAQLQLTVGATVVAMEPAFDPSVFSYVVDVPFWGLDVTLRTEPEDPEAVTEVAFGRDTVALSEGRAMLDVQWASGAKLTLEVTSPLGSTERYTISFSRQRSVVEMTGISAVPYHDAGDEFGHAVAVSGDTVVVGMPGGDSWQTGSETRDDVYGDPGDDHVSDYDSGGIYVFDTSGNVTAYLVAIDLNPQDPSFETFGRGDQVGTSVAIDEHILVAGAPGWNNNAGKAYVFVRDPSTGRWRQAGELVPAVSTEGSLFGRSVAVSGDRIVVGARSEGSGAILVNQDANDTSAARAGAAYVFERESSSGNWEQTAYLKASNTDAGDKFGSSVDIDGDFVVVGAPGEDGDGGGPSNDGARNAGAAYVFNKFRGTWEFRQYLKASNPGASDSFGFSVAIERLDGGSLTRVAIGAPGEGSLSNGVGVAPTQLDDRAPSAGAVYVFERPAFGWSQTAYIKASNPDKGDVFGGSISLDGDTLVVGASGESSGTGGIHYWFASNQNDDTYRWSGAAYVFELDRQWSQRSFLKAKVTPAGSLFGQSVAVDESSQTILVGELWPPTLANVPRQGVAWIFH